MERVLGVGLQIGAILSEDWSHRELFIRLPGFDAPIYALTGGAWFRDGATWILGSGAWGGASWAAPTPAITSSGVFPGNPAGSSPDRDNAPTIAPARHPP